MSVGRWAAAAACCVLAAQGALAEKAVLIDANPAAGQARPPWGVRVWPKVLPNIVPAAAKPPQQWSVEEIALAQARCTALLKGFDAVVVPELPIREGKQCGAPAPMKLLSIGRNPPVSFSPPPTVTCDLVAALSRWLERDVQPLARKHLGGPIVRIDSMSSYSCRNAYGRADRGLSEHGRANALDIAAFVTARGQTAMVVADWGLTAREIKEQAEVAAAKLQTEQGSASKFARPLAKPEEPSVSAQSTPVAPASQGIRDHATISIPGLSINLPGVSAGPALGLTQPNRLGGPKPASAPQPQAAPVILPQVKTQFLHAAHDSACRVFGTVLGPEANKAHKNHFHVDMAERIKDTKICE